MTGPLTSDRLETAEEALAYMVECTLATVEYLSDLARPPKSELQRQISITQSGCDAIKRLSIETSRVPRVASVIQSQQRVSAWASSEKKA